MEGNEDDNNQGGLHDWLQPFPESEDGLDDEDYWLNCPLPGLWEDISMENDQFYVDQRRQPVRQDVNESEEEQVARAEAYFRSCPAGYRFLPTDEQLIKDYLMGKVNNEPLPINRIRSVVLYDYRPEVLVGEYCGDNGQREMQWYFFTLRDRKYPNGTRPSRSAANGFWKASGVDKAITSGGQVIGFRKALDFYDGNQPSGRKTQWKMHEYRLSQRSPPPNNSNIGADPTKLDEWVLCKVYVTGGSKKSMDYQEGAEVEVEDTDQSGDVQALAATTNNGVGDEYLLNRPSPQMGSGEMGTTSNSTQTQAADDEIYHLYPLELDSWMYNFKPH